MPWDLAQGVRWRVALLPAAFGDNATAHRRLRRWEASGLWERIAALMEGSPAAGTPPTPPPTQGLAMD